MIPFGTCRALTWGAPFTVEAPLASPINVGAVLNLQTPAGSFVAHRNGDGYGGALGGPLEAGSYVLDNGTGSGEIRFRSEFSIPRRAFTWTNQDSFNALTTGGGATVDWSVLDPTGYIVLIGTFGVDGEISGGFLCYERADKGTFTIPGAIIERFRAGSPNASEFRLTVGHQLVRRILIPGFDVAEFFLPGQLTGKTIGLK